MELFRNGGLREELKDLQGSDTSHDMRGYPVQCGRGCENLVVKKWCWQGTVWGCIGGRDACMHFDRWRRHIEFLEKPQNGPSFSYSVLYARMTVMFTSLYLERTRSSAPSAP